MQKTALTTLALASLGTLLFACNKTENSATGTGKGRLDVYLTDDPGNYDSVFVDVQDIRINYGTDSLGGWQSLSGGTRGPVNLLQLVNDNDTLLGGADLTAGRIQQVRLVLGSNNYVVKNGQHYNLETPSAQQSGLKINVHQDIEDGMNYRLVLDFDAGRSIVQTGNGRYLLKPVIRATMQTVGGGLRGFVLPSTVRTAVYALNGNDTVAGTFTSDGAWAMRGIDAGTYSLSFVPTDSSYTPQYRSGVSVTNSSVTVVDTVRLQ